MITYEPTTQTFHLTNGLISYVLQITAYDVLTHVYFGQAVAEINGLRRYPMLDRSFAPNYAPATTRGYSLDTQPQEYPCGLGDYRSPAVDVRRADGGQYVDLHYRTHQISAGKPALPGLPATFATDQDAAETLTIDLEDPTSGLVVKVQYSLFQSLPVITRSAEIQNNGTQPVTLTKALSASLDLPLDDWEVLHLDGSWGRERQITRQRVTPGTFSLGSTRGTSSHQHNPFLALTHPTTTEDQGEAIGLTLIYSGNHQMTVEEDQFGSVRLQAGINPEHFSWQLQPQASFQTPEAVLAYSSTGLNAMSQAYHRLFLDHLMTSRHTHEVRPILINNWEATYFDFTTERLTPIIQQAARLGIEIFVLDDGWFGHRANDRSSLGDWFEFPGKLTGGLAGLAQQVHTSGMKFGLWFEPEMVSPDSDLYRQHPDWALALPDTTPLTGRGQYVLDFSRQEVRDYIGAEMRTLLDRVPIDYIKWDMNRSLSDVFSRALPPEQQGEVAHRYVLGLYELIEHLTSAYPNILFESCSGGGGRFDAGMLYYMPQTWTSDNTDAVDRLGIQYGTSLLYPPVTMGSHVSAVPNAQNGRQTSLSMRASVAMSANFGYELDLTELTDHELTTLGEQIAFYKRHRQLIQFGTFYRLYSPFDDGALTGWGMVDTPRSQAIFFIFTTHAQAHPRLDVVRFKGLAADQHYTVSGLTGVFTGSELMHVGFYLDPAAYYGDNNARTYVVTATDAP
ncbi:alpha-galactosidase [Lacticaseibacillus absianus]|uniref:alpha-galactosidase n=1 Tax=Lacticaseibacillus absianus TaxID=2729623 RepID=UPI0015CD0741|nr:alpha-galactosidase [Lacticaseibacillus absianus]